MNNGRSCFEPQQMLARMDLLLRPIDGQIHSFNSDAKKDKQRAEPGTFLNYISSVFCTEDTKSRALSVIDPSLLVDLS